MNILKVKPGKYVMSGYPGYWEVIRVDQVNGLVLAIRTDFTISHGKDKKMTKRFKASEIIDKWVPKPK